MIAQIHTMALWVAVALPLLLAIPALLSRLPWPLHLAILPAVVLVALPGSASLEFPWLFFGTGFVIDGEVRWILAMSVVVWFAAATVASSSRRDPAHARASTFFLLTLAGNLGAILATDLVGFFSFATVMGYGFYGLLITDGNAETHRAGRLYLIFLVVADLALFEALLLAASAIDNLRYETVRLAMAGISSSQFYLWMALTGFALKAGIWPVHLWLSAAFKSVPLSRSLLLGGIPVATGLLGAVRWLPLGEHAFLLTGMVIQVMGVAAILYAALRLFRRPPIKMLPVWASVAGTGLFVAALGIGLAHPAAWRQYAYFAYPFIASLGIFLALLCFAIGQLQDARLPADFAIQRMEALSLWAGRWIAETRRWLKDRMHWLLSHLRVLWLKALKHYQGIVDWQQSSVFVRGWSAKIIVFAVLGLALAWLAG